MKADIERTMRLPREPLLYFLLVGGVMFLLAGVVTDEGLERVVVTPAERARLAAQWQAQMGRSPTAGELDALVEQWVREEIYYREAIAMGLDENDVIIRRRLAQKLTFLTEDLAVGADPDQAMLRTYYDTHAERYAEPERYAFTHRFFSSDRRDDAEADARRALDSLAGDAETGDPFMLQRSYVDRSQREIGELFGADFAAALTRLPPGDWQGPVQSAYGWHLVKVERVVPAGQPRFEEVAERVAADFRQQQRQQANEAYYQSLLDRYEVIRS